MQQLDGLVHLHQQRPVDFVLVEQVGIGFKKTDLHERTGKPAPRVGMKQQCRGTLTHAVFQQMQALQQRGVGFLQRRIRQSLAAHGLLAKQGQCPHVQIANLEAWQSHPVPVHSLLAQQKMRQRRTFQFLLGAAAAKVVFALVADRAGVGLHPNLQQLLAVFH